MSNYGEENICIIHQQQIVAINMDLNSDCQFKRYCSKCLIDKTYDGTLCINSEIKEHIQEIRENFLEKKIYYLKQNVSTIESIQNAVQNLKVTFSSSLNKIFENLQIEKITLQDQQQSIEKKLQEVDIHNFSQFKLSTQKYVNQIENFKSLIRTSLEQIKNNEKLQFCLKEIENLQEESEELIFTRDFQNEEQNVIATPSLKILCSEHKKQIIAFDMNINRAKENRMACIHCIEENPNQYTSLKTVQEQWRKFEQQQKSKYLEILDQYKANKDQILEQVQVIDEANKEMNQQITIKLHDYDSNLTQQIEQIINQMGKNWVYCQQKEIFDNIENLVLSPGKKQQFSNNIQNAYANQEKEVNLNIFDSIQKIRETLKESFYLITKLIKINSNLQIKKNEIQIYEKINFQKYKLQLAPESIQLSLKITVPSKLIIKNQQIQISMFQKSQKYKFENQASQRIPQEDNCYALMFNKNDDKVLAGCGSKLQIFAFINGSLKNQCIVGQHQNNVTALCFIKDNQFFSGDAKGQINFWVEENKLWKIKQEILKEHTDQINSIIFSRKFNQIITCSNDKTIKILEQFNLSYIWVCQQKIDSHQNGVCSISLNKSETTLISSGSDKVLQVYQRQQTFILMQTIKVEDIIYRLQFIEDQSFCVQVSSGIHISFYDFNQNQKQYILSQSVEIQNQKSCCSGFPLDFCQKNSLIVCKHGSYVNILKKMNSQDYQTQQSLNFETMYLYGVLSSNGQYLITWDYKSKQLQVRKLIQN